MFDYERFILGCYDAVVEIKNEDDLQRFIHLMDDLGWSYYTKWLKRLDENYGIFNGARTDGIKDVCFEFQFGKGFTYGDKADYLRNCEGTKVLSLKDLIESVGRGDK